MLLLGCAAAMASCLSRGEIVALEKAEMIVTASRQIPFEGARWEPVALPHAWFRNPPQGDPKRRRPCSRGASAVIRSIST
jgi:hypothetical protein